MDAEDRSPDFEGVVNYVMHLFGEVMSRDAICAIVEHCGGDLTQSVDIIVSMTEDKPSTSKLSESIPTASNEISQPIGNATIPGNPLIQIPPNQCMKKPPSPVTYAGISQAQGAFPKQPPNKKPLNTQASIWTLQMKQIVEYHKQGSRTLILMRGLPGSGKTYLANELVQVMCPGEDYKKHVLSTDDFFMRRGQYDYNKNMLPEAHCWNQNRAQEAVRCGLSPIFVDNTNVEIWHMEFYVRVGVACGYIIEVLEPNTPWARKPYQLLRKNTHNVPIGSIRRMQDNYQNGVSGAYLIRCLGLSYPADKVPPVKRNIPPFSEPHMGQQDQQISPTSIQDEVMPLQTRFDMEAKVTQNTSMLQAIVLHQNKPECFSTIQTDNSATNNVIQNQPQVKPIEKEISSTPAYMPKPQCSTKEPNAGNPIQNQEENLSEHRSTTTVVLSDIEIPSNVDDIPTSNVSRTKLEDFRLQLDKIEELEEEWENGDAWTDDSKTTAIPLVEDAAAFTPKPPRNAEIKKLESDKFLPSASNYNDWTKISMFMPAWNEYEQTNLLNSSNVKPETASSSTSVEFGDHNNTNFKILLGTPRDINFYYMGLNEEKIPNKRMLDKSSMTNDHDHIAIETLRCKNEEKHFIAFRKMFKHISKVELRDIFDKCLGDVNWAVDIVLDGMANNQLHITDNETISDTEDFDDYQCECLAAYNIIPNVNTQPRANIPAVDAAYSEAASGSSTPKLKKERIVSESSIQLKRQIEQNVVISDSHYSDHCLKIMKMRRGELGGEGGSLATASNTTEAIAESNTSTDDDDSQTSCSDDLERMVNVDLGTVFVSELDSMFGRSDMTYPENIVTRVNMPVSLLNEINALWIESLMHQLDEQSRQSEIMLRQDEEFARKLALKEEQLAKAGQEPAVPDLKDIMDMELALSLYKKDVTAEWRNNEPNDMAARMTREKLYNLFPNVQPEVLSELLVAHDNNFQATVEVLLSSTGNGKILEEENGVAKFITKKELERHEKLIEEQKKALSEVEWPLLPKDVKVDMNTVHEYRIKASRHLAQRNLYYQRAQSFFNRNMTQIATYYSDVAALHKKKFDHANSLAAASLMQVHAANCTDNATIDLHFLRVPEAKESLDLFLDTHIQKLRETQSKGGPRFHTLFFITGRGLHSSGGPKIKPAVKRRLRERCIAFTERNPGLLCSKVCAEDKLTHEVP